MKPADLKDMENKLMEEIVRRRALGGYNADAPALLLLTECLYEIIRDLRYQSAAGVPPKKK